MENDEKFSPEPRLYEVGYHMLPTVAEEDIPGQTEVIKRAIETLGGTILSEGMPVLTNLAYPLPKVTANKRKYYTTAHFGWIKFEMPPEGSEALKKKLDINENVIRFIIVKTVKDRMIVPSTEKMAFMAEKKEGEPAVAEEPKVETPAQVATAAELDKTIEDLVIE